MIVTQFRKFTPLNIGLLVLVGTVLCLGIFPYLPESLGAPLVGPVLYELIPGTWNLGLSPTANVMVTLGITVIQALYINAVFNRYNFFSKPSFLIALMYMTLASLTLPFLVLSPILLCNFLLIWILDKLLKIYHRAGVLRDMYDLGLLVGLGSLLYIPFASMLIAVWAGLRLFRPFNWREWVAPLLGFVTLYFLLWVAYFWFEKEAVFLSLWKSVGEVSISSVRFDPYDHMIVVPVIFILALFMISLRQTIFKRIVQIRKTVQLLFILLLLSLGSFFLQSEPEQNVAHFLLTVPVLSVYTAYYFNYAQKTWFFESVYLLLVVLTLLFHFL